VQYVMQPCCFFSDCDLSQIISTLFDVLNLRLSANIAIKLGLGWIDIERELGLSSCQALPFHVWSLEELRLYV
jgi:hypothetical protein